MLTSLWRLRGVVARRQVVLFLLAVVVPSAVLVVMAARMSMQERELAHKRVIDERQRQVDDIRQKLLAYLEPLKQQQMTAGRLAPQAPIQLVARVDRDAGIVLPWDEARRPAVPPMDGGAVASAIRDGEHEELVAREPARAASHYARAAALARDPSERAYARLLVGRAWTKAGRVEQARAEYGRLLALPSDVRDEHGVPIWAYAAQRLVSSPDPAVRAAIASKISNELETAPHTPLTGRYLLRDLLDAVVPARDDARARALHDAVARAIRAGEQAVALQTAFPLDGLHDTSTPPRPRWVLFGEPAWLVSVAADAAANARLVAVSADAAARAAIDSTHTADLRLTRGEVSGGARLGDGFPGVTVTYRIVDGDDVTRRIQVQRWFAWAIVALVLSVTGFGGYFLWRDVRREVRTAAIRSQFVSSVSHELKTPLTAIRMFAETLRMGRARDEDTAAEYLDTIVNESERLTRLLNNVLEFSKMERGTTHFRLLPAMVEEPVRSAVRAMRYPLAQQGFSLTVDVAERLPRVLLDADAIEQAVLNLLANAMKYSGQAREIQLRVTAEADGVVVSVTDHGIGIAPADQERIFEKFYRASTPENRHIPGTGLGLTLVDYITRGHGGSVRVASAPGQGSTFSLVLPLAPAAEGAAPSDQPVLGARPAPL